MKILAVDTTTNVLAAGLVENGFVRAEDILDHKKAHSQKIMPVIEQILSDTQTDISEIDLFAAANGPGSFTGIRIGLATVKALAQATGKPVVPVNTLEALAYNAASFDQRVCALLDARNDSVYCAVYRFQDGKAVADLPPTYLPVEKLVEYLCGEQDKTILTGNDMESFAGQIGEACSCIILPPALRIPHASSVARAALENTAVPYDQINAYYINKPQAEREYEQRQ